MSFEIKFYQIAQKIIKKYFVYKTDKERHRDCLLVVPLTNGIHTTTKVQLIVECVKYGCLQLQKIIGCVCLFYSLVENNLSLFNLLLQPKNRVERKSKVVFMKFIS